MEDKVFHVGIDFGTSNCVAYVVRMNRYEHVPFSQNSCILPSIVKIKNGAHIVGVTSEREDEIVIKSVKRLIGRSYDEINHTDDVSTYGCPVVKGPDGMCWFQCGESMISTSEIATDIFKRIIDQVNEFTDGKIGRVVISVPANYAPTQRYYIRQAAEKAGITVSNLVNEPTAASVTMGTDTTANGYILVFDLGGGTVDVTILKLDDCVYRVESSVGQENLGGNDFDALLLHHIEGLYMKDHNCSMWDGMPRKKKNRFKRLTMERIVNLKHILSTSDSETIDLSDLLDGDCTYQIHRSTFESLIRPLVSNFSKLIEDALRRSEHCLTKNDIQHVILVGGGCFIPLVKRQLHDEFPRAEFYDTELKLEHVAKGCCICAKKKNYPDFSVFDVLSNSIGFSLFDGSIYTVFEKGMNLPQSKDLSLSVQPLGAVSFRTKLVEVVDESQQIYRVLSEVDSTEFVPDKYNLKPIRLHFEITIDGIVIMEAYALPENVKCVTKRIQGVPIYDVC